jgi:hypothetical protein
MSCSLVECQRFGGLVCYKDCGSILLWNLVLIYEIKNVITEYDKL